MSLGLKYRLCYPYFNTIYAKWIIGRFDGCYHGRLAGLFLVVRGLTLAGHALSKIGFAGVVLLM
jgi:ABC-type Mn2+/Zn2+ transport system permease subunit